MSTSYYVKHPRVLSRNQVLCALPKLGLSEVIGDEMTQSDRCITDGRSYVWMYGNEEVSFEKFGINFAEDILDILARYFGVKFLSEYEIQELKEEEQEQYFSC